MHCMLMDLLHGFEILSTTEETLQNVLLLTSKCAMQHKQKRKHTHKNRSTSDAWA